MVPHPSQQLELSDSTPKQLPFDGVCEAKRVAGPMASIKVFRNCHMVLARPSLRVHRMPNPSSDKRNTAESHR